MSHDGPSWQRFIGWLIAAVIALDLLVAILPRLLVPIVIVATVLSVLRLVWYLTRQ
jgi:Flp pilus assembly protein TadB